MVVGKDGDGHMPSRKSFLLDVKQGRHTGHNFGLNEEVGHNHEANNELEGSWIDWRFRQSEANVALTPNAGTHNRPRMTGIIVLDFFAGS